MKHLLSLTVLLLGTTAAMATPSLKADVVVRGSVVTVGDMFNDAGALSGTAIFRAPAPGTTGTVAIDDVSHAAAQVGLDGFDASGLTEVRVERAGTVVDAPLLAALLSSELTTRGVLRDGVTAEIHFSVPGFILTADAVDAPARLLDLRYAQGGTTFSARFTVAGLDQPVDLSGTVELMTTAPRLLATETAGTILTPADFDVGSVPVTVAAAAGYASLDQLVGKQLVRQSRAGMMLKPSDVSEPTAVKRNTLVTVLLRVGSMTLTVKGQALSTVAAGEPVDVLNTLTKKVLHGVAQPDGSVAIVTGMTVAGL